MDTEGREEVIDKVFLWIEKSLKKTKLIVITKTKKSDKKKVKKMGRGKLKKLGNTIKNITGKW